MAAVRAHVFDDRMPSTAEIETANQLRTILASKMRPEQATKLTIALDADRGGEVVLSPALAQSFLELLRHVGSGRAVTIVPTDEMLSTQRAADLLNVSRPYLIKLLEQEVLPYVLVGRHRRVKAQDLFDYRIKRDEERAEALSRLAEMDGDLI